MPKYDSHVFAALCFVIAAFGTGRADDARVIARFGNWSLIASEGEKVLTIGDPSGRLGVTCSDSPKIYLVVLQVIDQRAVTWDENRKARYFRFVARADGQGPKEFVFYVEPEQPMMAQGFVSQNPTLTGPYEDFWRLLKSARSTFSYGTPSGTFSFDVTGLSRGLDRFEELCKSIGGQKDQASASRRELPAKPSEKQPPSTLGNEQLLTTFGNWRISYIDVNTFNLGASTTGQKAGTFEINCYPGGVYALFIPFWALGPNTGPKLQAVTVWSDSHKPQDINLPSSGLVGVGISTHESTKPAVEAFLEVLGSATKMFAFSYDTTTLEFDATHLSAARQRFYEMCRKGSG
jgi:hypothetical protein